MVATAFNDFSIFKDNNLVCIEDGLQTVGNDETSSACYNRLHGMLNLAFCHSIYVRSGFIENENLWICHQGSSDRNELLLSCREDALVIIYKSIVLIRQAFDVVVNVGCLGCCLNHFLTSIWHTKTDIVSNRSAKQDRILQDNSHLASETI